MAAAAVANPEAPAQWRPKTNPWIIAATVAMAAFMEVLDTSIANVALPHIAGNLGASEDQATWVLTAYLVSNAVVLPMGGWVASVIGRKNFFLSCIVIFTISSFLCGIAPSLGLLLLFRVLQGAGGGGLRLSAQLGIQRVKEEGRCRVLICRQTRRSLPELWEKPKRWN